MAGDLRLPFPLTGRCTLCNSYRPPDRRTRSFDEKTPHLLFVLSAVVTASQQPAPPPVRPRPAPAQPEVRLVLLIAVDQFRYDYLTRFRKEFTGDSIGC